MGLNLKYEPEVVVEDITKLTEEEWKQYRQMGIGGSDAAAVCGISPWKTTRDLYEEKIRTKAVKPKQPEGNWIALEIGKRLEELVVQIFMKKTGLQPYAVRKMFCHPLHPFMLANVDYFVEIRDEIYIIECKTSFSFRMEEWENGAIPRHYQLQGQHYMAVTNVRGVIFLCLHGNNEDSFLMRSLNRDLEQEEELIEQEKFFWNDFVLAKKPPEYTEHAALVLKSIRERLEFHESEQVELPETLTGNVVAYLDLKEQKAALTRQADAIEEQMKLAYAPVEEALGGAEKGILVVGNKRYQVGYTKRTTKSINKGAMEAMQLLYPDICQDYAKTNISRTFYIKPEKEKTG